MTDAPNQFPPPPPGYYPPASFPGAPPGRPPGRQWHPMIVLGAIVLIAAAVVGGVMLLTQRGSGDRNQSQPSSSQDDLAAAPGTTTCQAWQKARAKMDDAPALPAAWDWDTPDVDTLIGERAKVINQALDEFEPQIKNEEPLMVAVFAHVFVKDKRTEMRRLTTHTWSPTDTLHANIDQDSLDKACNGEE